MAINYNDERFAQVESAKQDALKNVNNTYTGMIDNTDAKYNELIQASKDYATKQGEIQQQQANQTIAEINQQKEQTEKDYIKEQKGAYTDYQKATNQYGANAEKMASQGLTNTGYSESSNTNMYVAYQNRYAVARESYNKAVLNYDNQIAQARISNSAKLAEIAYNALQTQLETSIQGFQYKNTLLQSQLSAQQTVDQNYYQRYQDVVSQINTENSLAEQIRQYNETMAFQKQQAQQEQARWEREFALSQAKARSSGGSGGSRKSSSSKGSASAEDLTEGAPTSNKLSAGGVSFYNAMNTMQKAAPKGANSNIMANTINSAYHQGKINESDVKILAKKFKLE